VFQFQHGDQVALVGFVKERGTVHGLLRRDKFVHARLRIAERSGECVDGINRGGEIRQRVDHRFGLLDGGAVRGRLFRTNGQRVLVLQADVVAADVEVFSNALENGRVFRASSMGKPHRPPVTFDLVFAVVAHIFNASDTKLTMQLEA